jgi:hypothetical protein
MPPKAQTIHVDRMRLTGPWLAWWSLFAVACTGVWYLRGAKAVGEQVVVEVQQLRVEMTQARETMHAHDVRISTLEEWKRSRSSSAKEW